MKRNGAMYILYSARNVVLVFIFALPSNHLDLTCHLLSSRRIIIGFPFCSHPPTQIDGF